MVESLTKNYLIIGLGNPGKAYRQTRHNSGFRLLDQFAGDLSLSLMRYQGYALMAEGRLGEKVVYLAKPQTYMNASGRSVGLLAHYYRIAPSNLLVLVDDLDLPLGSIKLLSGGGSAGHIGMRSIISHLGTQSFPRLRIGIGRPPGRTDPADFVLTDFKSDELPILEESLNRAVECLRLFLLEGIQTAMNRCNAPTGDR
jgi:PTH1 family peptidyl-tRNA hydrolase